MDGLDITTSEPMVRRAGYQGRVTRPRQPWLKRHAKALVFCLMVVAPTVAATVYFFGFAADQFVSEARFVVRGPASQSPGVLSSLLQTAGVARAQDDTYAVQDYILSRDAMAELIRNDNLREMFERPEADLLSRFPLPLHGDTLEHFYDYYQKHVDVLLDTTTGVTALSVKTFRAEDSHRIASALLVAAEALVNRMNVRQRENAMRDARKEIVLAEERVQAVAGQIAAFRNREAILDPTKQSVPMLQGIYDLQAQLSRTNLQISQLTVSSPRSPLIADYQRRAAALQGQIIDAKNRVTGSDSSLVPKITAYDMLNLQREFADKQLVSATTSLEAARMQAERQQLYIDQIVQPHMSDYAAYPRRYASVGIVFAAALGIYLMLGLLVAGAREHRLV